VTTSPPAALPADWPHREASRRLAAGGFDWHVQCFAPPRTGAPVVWLLHGSGASAHSFADVVPHLAPHAAVVVPDLPGHGFTRAEAGRAARYSLPAVAAALQALGRALHPGFGAAAPALLAGHSAGAALALRWALDHPRRGDAPPAPAVLGLNPSLVAPPAAYTTFVAPLLHPLFTSGPAASFFAATAGVGGMVDRLLASTRSAVPTAQRARYRRLFGRVEHVQGTLAFMAAADLPALTAEGPRLASPLTFVVGEDDDWVPPRRLDPVIARAFPQATVLRRRGGHLMHEAEPAWAAGLIRSLLPA
jgi:magnesium chelatase accessory protein